MKQGLPQSNVSILASQFGETVPLAVTATTSYVQFQLPASVRNYECMVTNAGTKIAFINFGIGTSTVATLPSTTGTQGATPILPGAIYTFQKNSDAIKTDTCAAICAGADTTTLYFTSIQGS